MNALKNPSLTDVGKRNFEMKVSSCTLICAFVLLIVYYIYMVISGRGGRGLGLAGETAALNEDH